MNEYGNLNTVANVAGLSLRNENVTCCNGVTFIDYDHQAHTISFTGVYVGNLALSALLSTMTVPPPVSHLHTHTCTFTHLLMA